MSVVIQKKAEPGKPLSFCYGDEKIEFFRLPGKLEKQKVVIKVHPDCRVEVAAPAAASDDEVLAAVKKRSRWITRQLIDFRRHQEYITPRRYISGESHYYLGKQYQLKVVEAADKPQGVKLLRGTLQVTVRRRSAETVRQLLQDWYKVRAKDVFNRRLDAMLEQALWVTGRPFIRIQSMKTQWGSCSPNGRLTLNPHLVKAPGVCIDYVILHELCHIAEHNHSKRFYRLMAQVMPGWEKNKTRLDDMAARLLS